MKYTCLIALLLLVAAKPPDNLQPLLDAIQKVETGGCTDPDNAVGDSGLAVGRFQIHKSYWIDSRIPGEWEDCKNKEYAERVVRAYLARYCLDGDYEAEARTHNGGPKGAAKQTTLAYWHKVQKALGQ